MENLQTVPHHVSDDCWLSCPKSSEGCCNPETPKDKCTCGADQYNAWLGELRTQKDRLMKELEIVNKSYNALDDHYHVIMEENAKLKDAIKSRNVLQDEYEVEIKAMKEDKVKMMEALKYYEELLANKP